MDGFIKLSRSILSWEWYSDANTARVFLDILLHTNYVDGAYKGVEVKAGQCVTGLDAMASRLGLSKQNVRTAIKHLKKTGEISTHQVTHQFTLVTVENWAVYQGWYEPSNTPSNTPLTHHQHTVNTPLTPSNKAISNKEIGNNHSYSFPIGDRERLLLKARQIEARQNERTAEHDI